VSVQVYLLTYFSTTTCFGLYRPSSGCLTRCKWVPLILGTYSCIARFASRDLYVNGFCLLYLLGFLCCRLVRRLWGSLVIFRITLVCRHMTVTRKITQLTIMHSKISTAKENWYNKNNQPRTVKTVQQHRPTRELSATNQPQLNNHKNSTRETRQKNGTHQHQNTGNRPPQHRTTHSGEERKCNQGPPETTN